MIGFENYLKDQGFEMYNSKKERTDKYVLSSMVNLYNIWKKGSIEISVGLNEANKPPTLIHPRPSISCKKYVNGKDFGQPQYDNIIATINEGFDDSMNVCLQNESYEDIYKALFDNSITFEYDLVTK